MSRDKSVTVTRDTRDKSAVTFGVSHGTPTRPVPTRPISISYVCLWLALKNCRASLRFACHRRTADANSLPRTNQLKSATQLQTARAVGVNA